MISDNRPSVNDFFGFFEKNFKWLIAGLCVRTPGGFRQVLGFSKGQVLSGYCGISHETCRGGVSKKQRFFRMKRAGC